MYGEVTFQPTINLISSLLDQSSSHHDHDMVVDGETDFHDHHKMVDGDGEMTRNHHQPSPSQSRRSNNRRIDHLHSNKKGKEKRKKLLRDLKVR